MVVSSDQELEVVTRETWATDHHDDSDSNVSVDGGHGAGVIAGGGDTETF